MMEIAYLTTHPVDVGKFFAFHFDWSEVRGDAEGESTALVALKPNDPCVLLLPAYDKG